MYNDEDVMREIDPAAALARIEERQQAYEVVARRILDTLQVHTEKLDAILEAATQSPGPSPVRETLGQILTALHEQAALLEALPSGIAGSLREMEDDADMEPAAPDGFARPI